MIQILYILGIVLNFKLTIGEVLLNITNLENCDDILAPDQKYPVEVLSVDYQKDPNSKYIDTIHGSYIVRSVDTRDKEVISTYYKCPIEMTGRCNTELRTHIIVLDCQKFLEDDTGIWHMFSQGMRGSKCGEALGNYELLNAKLLPQYLVKFLIENENAQYRIRMLFHKHSTNESIEMRDIRACVDLEFQAFYQ